MNSSFLMSQAHALFSADGLAGLIFLIMVAVMLIGGLMACTSERLVRCVAGLVVCFVGVAGIYFYLNSPFVATMRQRLSMALGISAEQVNVKAKTAEKMGPVGRGESIEARAVCLLMSQRMPLFAHTGP